MFRFFTGILGSDHVNDDVPRRRFARARLQTKRVFQAKRQLAPARLWILEAPQNKSRYDFDHLRRLRQAYRARRLVEMRELSDSILQ